MEIEFKLSCTPAAAQALSRHLTRLTGTPPQKLQLQNTYYDTPNQDLRANGIALRVRKQGRLELQTVKCAGVVSGGLSSRPEWEHPYKDRFDFSVISDATVREQLETMARLPGYRAMLDTNFSRHAWHWRPDADTDIEIVLDRGRILAGGREEPICEIELELIKGQPEQLLALVADLGAHVPLFPSPLSKATRGSLLLSGPRPPKPLAQLQARDGGQAFAQLAQDCLDHVSVNLPVNLVRFSSENLHQVNVGLQRLRSLLQLYRPFLRQGWPHATIGEGARSHMHVLSPALKLGVMLNDIVAPAVIAVEPRAAQALQKKLVAMREQAFAIAEAHLQSQAFSGWLLQSSLALHARPLKRKSAAEDWRKQARQLADLQLAAYAKLLEQGMSNPQDWRKLGKHGKLLHYLLTASALHPKVSKRLARLQASLGELGDLHEVAEIIATLPALHTTAIADIGQYHLSRYAQLQAQAAEQIKQLRRELRALRK